MTGQRSFLWPGAEAMDEVKSAIARGEAVDLVLPASEHHALYMHLHENAQACDAASLELADGAEILSRIAKLPGFEDLERLVPAVRQHRYRVALDSPPPALSFTP
jgi:hypothetical protein